MLGSFNPDVLEDVETEYGLALEAGSEVQPTQPPHPSVVDDTPSGYPEDSGTIGMPNIVDIFSVDDTPLASLSVSGVDATSYPDLSVAASISAATGACRSSILNPSHHTNTKE